MSYIPPATFLPDVISAGKDKLTQPAGVTILRAVMAGAILALAANFAIMVAVQTGLPIVGAILFPVGFCLLILFKYDLLTGVFVLTTLAWLDDPKTTRPAQVLKNWGLVFTGNFIGAVTVALMATIMVTTGFTTEPTEVGEVIANIGQSRTLGYKEHGLGGMLTLFTRAMLCNWMVSMAVIGAFAARSVSGKVLIMWMPIMLFFAMGLEHSVVNMFLFPAALMMGGAFSVADYLLWNEIPVVLGNLLGGVLLTGLPLYYAHRTRR